MRTFSLSPDAVCAARASEQYGLLTRGQAHEAGLSPDAIKRRVKAHLLIPLLPGVFRLAGVPRSWHQRAMATHLWAGESSLICGHAAAALNRLDGFSLPNVIDVWTPRSLKTPSRLVVVHRGRAIEIDDRASVNGIPVLTPVRALIDIASITREERVEIALEDLLHRRLARPQQIADRLGRLAPNYPGRGVLLELLALRGSAPPAESGLEVRVIRMLREEDFPPPIRQRVIDDDGNFVGRVDLVYPDQRLILEVDSFRHHSGRDPFERDRQRINALGAMGWVVLHVTHLMLRDQRESFLKAFRRAYYRDTVTLTGR